MTSTITAPSTRTVWKTLEAHYKKLQPLHLRKLFADDPNRGERMTAEAVGIYLDYSKNRITDETLKLLLATRPRNPACASGSTPCSAARRSTSPRTAPCCTSRCARRRASRSSWTATNVVPQVHAVLDKMADFCEPRAQRRLEGPHRQAHPQRRQHRHRRLRPRAGDGLRSAQALQRARDDVPLRLQRRRHRFRRSRPATSIPTETLFIVSSKTFTTLETMTNAHTARDWSPGASRRRRESRGQAFRRRLDQCREGRRSSASIPPTCSGSGIGSAAATRWTRPSASRRCSPSARSNFRAMLDGFHQMDEHFRTAPFERNLPVLLGLLAVWYTDFFGAQTVAVLPYEQYLKRFPGLPAAVDDGEQRQARHARRNRRSITKPARSTGASRAPTASTPSIN